MLLLDTGIWEELVTAFQGTWAGIYTLVKDLAFLWSDPLIGSACTCLNNVLLGQK